MKKKTVNKKDPYGIPNTNYTLIDKKDPRWNKYKAMRIKCGFDPSEFWSFSYTICSWLYPRVEWYYKHVVSKWEPRDVDEFDHILYDLWYLSIYCGASNDMVNVLSDAGVDDREAVYIVFNTYVDSINDLSDRFPSIIQMGW